MALLHNVWQRVLFKKGRRKCCKLLWWWLAFTNTDSFFSLLPPYGAAARHIRRNHKIASPFRLGFPSAPPRKEERNVTWKIGHKYGNLLSVMGCRKTQRKTGFGFFFCRQKTLSIKDERQSGPDSLKKRALPCRGKFVIFNRKHHKAFLWWIWCAFSSKWWRLE